MPKKNIGPRISEEAAEYLGAYFQSLNFGAQFVLESWPVLHRFALKEMRGLFSKNELKLLLDAHNHYTPTSQTTGLLFPIQILNSCDMDRLDAKWSVDKEELMEKIACLKTFYRHSLEVWASGFRRGGMEDYIQALL